MQRTFTVTLTEDEAATVWRMAELTGAPAAVIVRHLHRMPLFAVMREVCTSPRYQFTDPRTGWTGWREDLRDECLRGWAHQFLNYDPAVPCPSTEDGRWPEEPPPITAD